MPGTTDSIMKARFPGRDPELPAPEREPAAEAAMEQVMGIITAVRNIRGEMNISPSVSLSAMVLAENPETRDMVDRQAQLVRYLARLENLEIKDGGDSPKAAATAIVQDVSVSVLLEGVIDVAREAERLDKEIAKLDKEITTLVRKLENESFVSKAPEDVVEKVRMQYTESSEKREKLENNRKTIQSIAASGGA